MKTIISTNRSFILGFVLILNTTASSPTLAHGAATPFEPDTDSYEKVEAGIQPKPPTTATLNALQKAADNLPVGDFADGANFSELTKAKLIAPFPNGIRAISPAETAAITSGRPAAVNPSTYNFVRKAVMDSGLYKIADDVYQIRGDLAHITLVRGETGWIVLDAGTTREFTSAAWAFAHPLLPGGTDVPVSTVIYSHSHVDHFGGVKGLVSQDDVSSGKVKIIAPYGFSKEAVAENVIAGSAMRRRSHYHFGSLLDFREDGRGFYYVPSVSGEFTLIAPTEELPEGRNIVTPKVVDGIEFLFKDISHAEAPASTMIFLPKYKLLFNSELFFAGLHNIYTLRGAQVRDALGWSQLINEIIYEWGPSIEIMTGPHGPNFNGNARIIEYMKIQRDNYGFIHNQTLRLINSGMKLQDVGQTVEEMVPKSLAQVWHTRGYHGTYSHNARGVVNRYIGFYDGNPANLNPLQQKPEAKKYVAYMGGADRILNKAKEDFNRGEYRFVATVLNKLVIAEPNNWTARHLLADTFEQLGYQSEGPQWRNAYLTAALELRAGKVLTPKGSVTSADMLAAASTTDFLNSMAVHVNGQRAAGKSLTLNIHLTDSAEYYFLELSNANLSHIQVEQPMPADATLTVTRQQLLAIMTGRLPLKALDEDNIEGSLNKLGTLFSLLDMDNRKYPLVPMPE